MSFTIGSLFDGSGGFPLAAFMAGGVPVWASEIEPYPIAVTKSRFPHVKHLGSVTDINGAEVDPVDVITFGSPCQDLSVAGKRAGLKHEANGDEETTRSGLFMEAVRIIKEMREKTNGVYPRIAVWENVPGAFSSNKGEDFRIVCEELIKIVEPSASMPPVPKNGWAYADCYVGDGWSLAYRVLDAQHWGVPQRRRRIYLVADFRGQRAGKVLFERDGVRGYFETGRTPWQATPADAQRGVGADDREGDRVSIGFPLGFRPENVRLYDEVATTLCNGTRPGFTCGVIERQPSMVGFDAYQHHGWRQSEVCGTLTAGQNDSILGDTPLVAVSQPLCMATQQGGAEIMEDKCPTITAAAGMSGNNQPVVCYGEARPIYTPTEQYLFENHSQDTRYKGPLDVAPIVSATFGMGGNNQPFVVEPRVFESHPMDSRIKEVGDIGPTVTTKYAKGCADTPLVMEPFCKSARARSADDATTWVPGRVANTINTFDQGETRANELVVLGLPIPIHDQPTRFSGKRGDKSDGKGNGLGVGEPGDPMNTLTGGDRHAVAYLASGKDTSGTLMASMATKQCLGDQEAFSGDYHIIEEHGECYQSVTGALCACDYKGVGSQYVSEDKLIIDPKQRYIVRRLTPTECARLQGFPDKWGHPDQKDDLTDEEYRFWLEVRNTHAAINGRATKEYTKQQMLTWYNKLHTDSSEYKMWGNGIALPNALYVMQGIAEVFADERN